MKPASPEYIKAVTEWSQHKLEVGAALSSGKTIPSGVLESYPDLAKKHGAISQTGNLKTTDHLSTVAAHVATGKPGGARSMEDFKASAQFGADKASWTPEAEHSLRQAVAAGHIEAIPRESYASANPAHDHKLLNIGGKAIQDFRLTPKGRAAMETTKLSTDNPEAEALILAGPDTSEFAEVLTLGHNFPHPKTRNGKPCFYYWKESLELGSFLDVKNKPFSVAPGRVDTIIRDYRRAKANGFEPPATSSHKVTDGKNYGYVVDIRKNANGNLELLHQFMGEEEKNEALNKKSSICLLRNVTDERGNFYEELIDHNAIIPNPRISTLKDFEPALAASRGQFADAIYLTRSAEGFSEMPCSPEQMDYVKNEAMDGDKDGVVSDENAMDHLISHHKMMKKSHGALKLSADRVTELETEKLELSRAVSTMRQKPSAAELSMGARLVKAKRDQAVADGYVLPVVADAAISRFLKKPVELDKLTLSREVEDDDSRIAAGLANAEDFFDLLKSNKLVKVPTGSNSVPQVLQLSRTVPGKEDAEGEQVENQLLKDAERLFGKDGKK